MSNNHSSIIVVGGGASGFFCALEAARRLKEMQIAGNVTILEAGGSPLRKVKISGGGRCNVTHHQFDLQKFAENYPRGQRELRGPLQSFGPKDTWEWFQERGVPLKVEKDGRIFPESDQSQTIIDCLLNQAKLLGVKIQLNCPIESLEKNEIFYLKTKSGETLSADRLVLATGGGPQGRALARQLDLNTTECAPSLFSFKIQDSLISGLEGISLNITAKLIVGKESWMVEGPAVITHWGISGPAILKLSALAALALKKANYKAVLKINWTRTMSEEKCYSLLESLKKESPNKNVTNLSFPEIPHRLWQQLCSPLSGPLQEISKKDLRLLAMRVAQTQLEIFGKNRFKDEFVECGGVDLKGMETRTMESRQTPGLYVVGELLNIDGLTGGFNFQNAWTTGFLAGGAVAESLKKID